MISICVEIKTECKHCGGSLVLNTFTNKVFCHACQKINEFPYGFWKNSILESALKQYSELHEGEGQNSTVMTGEYSFQIMYGRLNPRCGKCKTALNPAKFGEYAKLGKAVCEKCGNEISFRTLPDILKGDFETVQYLIGEDTDMLAKGEGTAKTPNAVKPVLFSCPSCGGNLKIDGSDRMVTCSFCSSQIYLPDDLWFRLHPAKVVERWFMVLDENQVSQKPCGWYYLSDAVIDKAGNLYFASADDDGHFLLWSMGADFKTRWKNSELNYSYENTGLAPAEKGRIYIWDKGKHSLLVIAADDGSVITKTSGREQSEQEPVPFNLKDTDSLSVDADGTLLVLKDKKILRFSADGRKLPTWGSPDAEEKKGFFSRLFGSSGDDEGSAPDVIELKNHPERVDTDYTFVTCGFDGFIYFMEGTSSDDASIAKYDREGEKLWCKVVPLSQKECRPCIDLNGNVYILGTVKDDNINLIKLDAVTMEWETLVKDIKEGGKLNDSDKLAVSADGSRIYCFNSDNGMRVFDENLNMIYISEQSKEDDKDVLDEQKEKIEKDEEIK